MHVIEVWRHPVKSLQGEPLTETDVVDNGVAFDRMWGICSETTGHILTARRRPPLLLASSVLADGEPVVTLPDGGVANGCGPRTDAALSAWLDEPVSLVEAANAPASTGEFFADATDDSSEAITWTMPAGRFVDAMPILLVTTATLRTAAGLYPAGEWSTRRFRPNVVVDAPDDGWLEDGWLGRKITIGDVAIVPRAPCQRCTMVTRPQPGLDRDLDIFRTLSRQHGGNLGVWCTVERTGTVRVGDPVSVE